MYRNTLDVIEFKKWNRKLLNIFWLIISICLITEVAIFFLVAVRYHYASISYLINYLLKPTLVNILLLLITELLYRFIEDKFKEGTKYLIITVATLLVCNLVYVHYAVSIIYVSFIFPIMLSAYYGSKKITIYSLIINMLTYLLIIFLYLPTRPAEKVHHNITEVCTNIALILSAVLIVYSFIDRFEKILESYVKMYENERELTIKNFVMEFNSKMEPVTGLYNHKTFYEYLEKLIEQSVNFNFPLSLAVFDIDNFKRVNDTYGHSLGDDVIKALAEIIKSNIGTDDYAARYGGEEFAIIFTDKDKHMTFEIVEKIRAEFNNKIIDAINNEMFSVSAGICELSESMTKQTLFENADTSLYTAKHAGKNKTVIYEDNKSKADIFQRKNTIK